MGNRLEPHFHTVRAESADRLARIVYQLTGKLNGCGLLIQTPARTRRLDMADGQHL